jgi:hypothetical protein
MQENASVFLEDDIFQDNAFCLGEDAFLQKKFTKKMWLDPLWLPDMALFSTTDLPGSYPNLAIDDLNFSFPQMLNNARRGDEVIKYPG